jgi:TetR/AcrR family tetracycline transcriptional repressor
MVSLVKKAPALDEARVLDAAFAVLETHGFEGLTIRRIADELGVKNPALYWHFRNKQEIVNRMAARLLGKLAEADIDGTAWRPWLEGMARTYRRTLLGARDGAELLSNANLSRSEQVADYQRGLKFLASFGFSDRDALIGMTATFDYALGITYEHQTDRRVAADTGDPDVGEGATVFEAMRGMRREDAAEALFEGGLALILDGLALRQI